MRLTNQACLTGSRPATPCLVEAPPRHPPSSPRASVPNMIRERGGVGIVEDSHESSARGAGRGCEQGTQPSPPANGTTGREETSTGGGFPGTHVREQNGQQDAGNLGRVNDPWGCGQQREQETGGRQSCTQSVHQGLGQQETPQTIAEVWDTAVWEEIVPRPQSDRIHLEPANQRQQTRLEDKLRDQQCASQWHNRHLVSEKVQTNLDQF
jgi:hypothetical protein